MTTTVDMVTLLAGGDAVYIYPDITNNERVAFLVGQQRMVLDVAYPAEDTTVTLVDESRLKEIIPQLEGQGVRVVDTREAKP